MAKWTKRNNPHAWKKSKARKRRKGSKTMAKKKRRPPRRSGGGRRRRRGGGRRGGGLLSLSKRDVQLAALAAGGYGYLVYKSAQASGDEYKWFKEAPVIKPAGRAGTYALGFGALYMGGIGRKWTKPLAIGLGAYALVNFARRGFKLYDSAAPMDQMGDGEGAYLEGDVDVSLDAEEEFQEAA